MYILVNDKKYPCSNPKQSNPYGTWFRLDMEEAPDFELPVEGKLGVYSEDDFEMVMIDTSMYMRQEYEGGRWLFTNQEKVIIPEPEPYIPTIEEVREQKISEMSSTCNSVITAGINVGEDHYSMSLEDQLNILTLQASVIAGQTSVPYHADGESCRMYSAEEFLAIGTAATNHKVFHESYFNSLRDWINAIEEIEAVQAVFYGVWVPEECQTEVLQGLLLQMGVTSEDEFYTMMGVNTSEPEIEGGEMPPVEEEQPVEEDSNEETPTEENIVDIDELEEE